MLTLINRATVSPSGNDFCSHAKLPHTTSRSGSQLFIAYISTSDTEKGTRNTFTGISSKT